MNLHLPLNDGWEFTENCSAGFLSMEPCEGVSQVRLPHTCKITPYDYFDEGIYQMVCGYRRLIDAPAEWEGKSVLLRIGAAAHYAEVFLNGEKLAEHRNGYTAFTVDLGPALKAGEANSLAIRLDTRESLDQPPFGHVIDYMTYGGLYREVCLDVKEPEYIEDVYAAAVRNPEGKSGHIESLASFKGLRQGHYYELRQQAGPLSGKMPGAEIRRVVKPEESTFRSELAFYEVLPWDVDSPELYQVTSELWRDGELIDTDVRRIGFRTAFFDKEGFHLNGRLLKIRGLDRHQSWPYFGYAAPASLQRQDAEILKNELGLNAVRTSHYPQSQHFMDRCDELGLLVFTEIPGWQHIGGDAWKDIAVENVREMVVQYRNHPSVILWGVRINESQDDDELYTRTNALAHELDPYRQTGGVRYLKKSSLLEDVYTYNDFSHDGTNAGCEPKKNITPDLEKGYLISEYNGHMFPTKAFDSEYHRLDHVLRHARVMNDVAAAEGVSGAFGWVFADYNTHKDFGSGDRICYHGVLDMYRNFKPAAYVYAAQQTAAPVLYVTSQMDIGEHPTGNPGKVYIITNADSVKMYRNDVLLHEYTREDSEFKDLAHGPILISDYVGSRVETGEGYKKAKADVVKDILNYSALYGSNDLPPAIKLKAAKAMALYGLTFADAYTLYGKYIGGWGDAQKTYRFEAYKDGKLVQTLVKAPAQRIQLCCNVSSTVLTEGDTYDMASVRVSMCDENGNVASFANEPVELSVEGPAEIVGPRIMSVRGGLGGCYIRTAGKAGHATLTLSNPQTGSVSIEFEIN